MIHIKNSSRILLNIGIFILIGSAFTYELMRIFIGNRLYLGCVIMGTFLIVIASVLKNSMQLRFSKQMMLWLLMAVLSVFRNVEMANGVIDTEIIWLCYLLASIFLTNHFDWQENAIKYINVWGGIHVFSTLILFIFRELYSMVYNIWGYFPNGTDGIYNGYRAGITTHYSQNAMYIVFVLIVAACSYFCKEKKERTRTEFLWLIMVVVALMLTAKRAHLVFGIISIIIVYYYMNTTRKSVKIIRMAGGVFMGLIAIILLYICMPSFFETILGRFLDNGYEDITSGRLPMWKLAITLFIRNPIFGVGWGGYKYYYREYIWGGWNIKTSLLNTHNVYLQVLCETGIVGFTIFVYIFYCLLRKVIIEVRRGGLSCLKYRKILAISLGMICFFLLYSLTGCCLYDLTFHIFIICMAMLNSIHFKKDVIKR